MKVHVVTQANRALYTRHIEQMHRQRHRLFVDELGWRAIASPTGLEIDSFDDDSAVYLIACENDRVAGSMRLLPAWRRCMVQELFSEYLTEPLPVDPGLWEWTRYCPGLLANPRELVRTRAALLTATVEFALSRGVTHYMAFGEVKFLSQLEELDWSPSPLGLPRRFDEGTAMVMHWAVKPQHLAKTRRRFKLSQPVTVEASAYTPDLAHMIDPHTLEAFVTPAWDMRSARPRPVEAEPLETLSVQGRA